ncbi:hypothetical protein HYV57_04975 [Candidatus Peregrinibacteria bacterium]|nr:hypothetical protein [Candidatus Peregrinibacteria bacterium]
MKPKNLLKVMSTLLVMITALSPLAASAATSKTGTTSKNASTNLNAGQTSTGKIKTNLKNVIQKIQSKQGITSDISDKTPGMPDNKYPVPALTSKAIEDLKKATSLLEDVLSKTTVSMEEWEKAREQIIKANESYIAYLKTLKSALDAQISSKAITEISNTDFINREVMVISLFNGAYEMVTKSWIQSIEQKFKQDVDDEKFAMDALAKIATMQVVYNAYVSPLTVVGAQGMLVTEAIEKTYVAQYNYANVTIRDLIKDYAANVLRLTGDDYTSFTNYYLGRLDTDVIALLNTIKQKNDEAKGIYVNDIAVIGSTQDKVIEFINSLLSLVDNPLNFSLEAIVDILGDMMNAMEAIKQATAATVGSDFRAQAQMATIKQTAPKVVQNVAALIKDLAYELKIKKDTTHCKKWKGTDASVCSYN